MHGAQPDSRRAGRGTRVLLAGLGAAAALVGLLLFLRDGGHDAAVEAGPVPVATPGRTAPAPELEADRTGAPDEATTTLDVAAETPVSQRVEPSAAPEALSLEVLESDGSPAAGRPVLLVVDREELDLADTDAEGRVEFAASGTEGLLIVSRAAAPPAVQSIDLQDRAQTITLAEGLEVSGVVLVDGAPPDEPLPIGLFGDDLPLTDAGVPEKLTQDLPRRDLGLRPEVETAEGGAFRFHGLPDHWSGRLRFPRHLVIRNPGTGFADENLLSLEAPVRGLVVELERLPTLTGRVVAHGTREPVQGAAVRAIFDSGSGRIWQSAPPTDADGRFRTPLPDTGFEKVEVRVASDEGGGRVKQSWERAELGDPPDVGDVELARARELTLRVVDPAGEPIEGAAARGQSTRDDEGSEGTVARGAADGLVRVSTSVGADRWLRVAALGFAARLVEIDTIVSEPHVVELRPGNLLSVELEVAEGIDAEDLRVQLGSEGPLFAGSGSWTGEPMLHEELAGRPYGAVIGPGIYASNYVPEEGRVEVQNLTAGEPVTLKVLDAVNFAIHEEELLPLGPSEHRTVRVAVAAGGRPFVGRVVDDRGDPISRASVRVSGAQYFSRSSRTDEDGEFRFDAVLADRLDVTIQRDGFAKQVLKEFPLPPNGAPAEIRLAVGHELVVRVLDENGRGVPAAGVRLDETEGDASWWERGDEDGSIEFNDLPGSPLEASLHVGGASYAFQVDPLKDEHVRRVPVHGRVELEVDLSGWQPEPGTEDRAVRVKLSSADTASRVLSEWMHAPESGPVSFPSVLPGAYDATLERTDLKEDGDAHPPLLGPVRVEVHASETTRARLAL